MAKLPTIAAYSYKKSIGQPFIYPQKRSVVLRELPADDVRGADASRTRSIRTLSRR